MNDTALDGLRVVDLAMAWAGGFTTKLLGDMGAEVIKVEALKRYDANRGTVPPPPGAMGLYPHGELGERPWNRCAPHSKRNRSKLGITLDLTTPEGKALFLKLVKISDIVVENFNIKTMSKLGLDYSRLKEVKPDIIYISMSSQGQFGPESEYISYGTILEQTAGASSLIGYPDSAPMMSGINYPDPLAAFTAVGAILSAVHRRIRTGQGAFIDLSQREATTHLLGQAIMDYTMNGRLTPRMGNRHPTFAPHGCYPCRGDDQWVTIAVTSDAEWQGLRRAMGDPSWAKDERFDRLPGRHRSQEEIDKHMAEWTANLDKYEVMQRLQANGVPSGAVLKGPEFLNDPQLKERCFFETVDNPEVGSFPFLSRPMKLSKTPAYTRRPAPGLGQHNRYVYQGLLGLSNEEFEQLEKKRIIGTVPPAFEKHG